MSASVTVNFSKIMGHRGAPSVAPENTLGGFRKAAELGARWIELDVSLLGDGTTVVHHDNSTDRCSDRQASLDDLTTAELSGINNAALFPDWPAEPVPTLRQVLDLFNELDLGMNLEIKDHGVPAEDIIRPIIAELEANFNDYSRLVVSSFSYELLACFHRLAPQVPLGLLYDELPDNWQDQARALNAFSIHLDWQNLSYNQTRAVKDAGYPIFCWTANDPEAFKSLWHWGVDAVISNNPQDFFAAGHDNLCPPENG